MPILLTFLRNLGARFREKHAGRLDSLTQDQLAALIAERWATSARPRLTQTANPFTARYTWRRSVAVYLTARRGVA